MLFENAKVQLAHIPDQKEIQETREKKVQKADNSLFEKLRKLRLKLAKEEDIPAYLIFNDATLKEMEKQRPMTDEDFMAINGVGQKKMQDYGYQFIKEIIAFSKEKREKKKSKKGNTHKVTYELYKEGLSVEEISKKRELASTTVYSHLAKLYADGKDIDLNKFLTKADLDAVKKARVELEDPKTLKPYYEHFNEAIDYWTIRFALTVLEKED